jgi:hypothetical protein
MSTRSNVVWRLTILALLLARSPRWLSKQVLAFAMLGVVLTGIVICAYVAMGAGAGS